MPHSRPMPQIDSRCHEIRVREGKTAWRVIYSIEPEEIVVLAVFRKKDPRTPHPIRDHVIRMLRKVRE